LTNSDCRTSPDEGAKLDAVSYVTAMEKREALGRHFIKFHQDWDLLVTTDDGGAAVAIVESSVVSRQDRSTVLQLSLALAIRST